MSFYPQSAARSHEWTIQAGETLTVDLRRAGPHERISWAWRLATGANASAQTQLFAEVAISDPPAARDWHPETFRGEAAAMEALSRPAAWIRFIARGTAATVQLLAPGPVTAAVA